MSAALKATAEKRQLPSDGTSWKTSWGGGSSALAHSSTMQVRETKVGNLMCLMTARRGTISPLDEIHNAAHLSASERRSPRRLQRVTHGSALPPTTATAWRKGTAPREFNSPVGVAVGHGRLYVSECDGCRIQVLTLEGLLLQVLDSPDGEALGGLCVDGNRIWCVGVGPEQGTSWVQLLRVE